MLQAFWANHQRFILAVGGVVALFLICDHFISRLAASAQDTYRECASLEKKIDSLHKRLRQTYWVESRRLEHLSAQEAKLREMICLPPEPDLSAQKSLLILLNRRVDEVWRSAQDLASGRGLALPEKLTGRDFGVEPDYGASEYGVLFSYLDVVARALPAVVRAGMTRIGKPDLLPANPTPITGASGVVGSLIDRGLSMTVEGPYESFIRLFSLLAAEKEFLQVRLAGDLRPVRATEDTLRGTLELRGILIAEPETGGDTGSVDPGPARGARARR